MAISTMYPAMPGSPKTTLTADITADATSLTVADCNVLPAAPNILVIGDDENAEVICYNAKSGNTVSGLIRALGGTVASAWTAGTEVARNFTSFDHDRFKENIEDLATNKADSADVYTQTEIDTLLNAKQNNLTFDNSPTANSSNPVKSNGIKTALDGKQNTLTFDSTPTASSTNPVTSDGVKTYVDGRILYFYQQTVSAATSAEIMRITDSRITTDTVVLECSFANPASVLSAVSWRSYNGYITFSGTCASATTANVTLGLKGN